MFNAYCIQNKFNIIRDIKNSERCIIFSIEMLKYCLSNTEMSNTKPLGNYNNSPLIEPD